MAKWKKKTYARLTDDHDPMTPRLLRARHNRLLGFLILAADEDLLAPDIPTVAHGTRHDHYIALLGHYLADRSVVDRVGASLDWHRHVNEKICLAPDSFPEQGHIFICIEKMETLSLS